MNKIEWLNRYVLPNYFIKSELSNLHYKYDSFEVDHAEWSFYLPPIFHGRILYRDSHRKKHYSKSISIQVIEEVAERYPLNDLNLCNDLFMHTRIVPFFSTLSKLIYDVVPKFHYMSVSLQNDDENVALLLEEDQFRQLIINKHQFLDLSHLELLMRKVGKFHAFSYRAKELYPETFRMLAQSLKTDKWLLNVQGDFYHKLLVEHFYPLFSKDERYSQKLEIIQSKLKNPGELLEEAFTHEEDLSIINIGIAYYCPDFFRFKYNSENIPTDVKFYFLRHCRYCNPILDVAYALYIYADQSTRDRYWHHLLDTYYTSLRNTFPESCAIPEKNLILGYFKRCSLLVFLYSTLCLPYIMERAENPNLNWYPMLYSYENEEYKYSNWFNLPTGVRFSTSIQLLRSNKSNRSELILDILRDIIDRGFF